ALGSATGLFISTEDGGGVLCRQLNPFTYRLCACDGEEVRARVVYAGATSAKLEIEGAVELSEATDASELPTGARAKNITFTGTVTLRWQPAGKSLDADLSGPFVDLTELEVRRDGRVRVRVEASDRNGVDKVCLEEDGQRVAEFTRSPYEFVSRPQPGWHTYRAYAVDASPNRNVRYSYKRSVNVQRGYTEVSK
ncbi:MAG: Ig-like domain-containing protein, partial [Candidatus Hydrogenedentota bacterium]